MAFDSSDCRLRRFVIRGRGEWGQVEYRRSRIFSMHFFILFCCVPQTLYSGNPVLVDQQNGINKVLTEGDGIDIHENLVPIETRGQTVVQTSG
jgi:hypothetical protein